MLALCLMFSETKNYAGIIGLGPWALLLHIIKPDITAMVIDLYNYSMKYHRTVSNIDAL